uniref:Uncharacterized protein n=1 Tax=Anguilla anguilla TaxID=7936 RepID=A0A0E9UUC5_ANGAN
MRENKLSEADSIQRLTTEFTQFKEETCTKIGQLGENITDTP